MEEIAAIRRHHCDAIRLDWCLQVAQEAVAIVAATSAGKKKRKAAALATEPPAPASAVSEDVPATKKGRKAKEVAGAEAAAAAKNPTHLGRWNPAQ